MMARFPVRIVTAEGIIKATFDTTIGAYSGINILINNTRADRFKWILTVTINVNTLVKTATHPGGALPPQEVEPFH